MISNRVKTIVIECICFLYVLLFVYAATNKFIDFDGFQVQLAQSPLLSSFASWIAWLVPILEVIIAGLLCIPKARLIGLYCGFCLMVMFSIYIVIILNFSPFVPCSCGGILEKLGWKEHLVFNILYCLLAIPGILFQSYLNNNQRELHVPIFKMTALSILGATTMAVLFVISEDMIHHRNNFTRRFPVHPAEFLRDYQLTNTSYIAGAGNGKVYIGNVNDPLKILEFDVDLKSVTTRIITTNEPDRPFKQLRITVKPPYFYLSDGIEAFAFRGTVKDWKAKIWIDKLAYYNSFVPMDSNHVAIRAISGDNHESIIGVMQKANPNRVIFNKALLDKQIDGFFDTDGKLLFNEKHQQLIYVYLYRNEYVITDTLLQSKKIANTIDTTSRAKIKVAYVDRLKTKKIASPMRVVNKTSATDGDYLYVNSKLIGQFEETVVWDRASIIDVYNITNSAYLFSFYLYDKDEKKISEFVVKDGKVFTIAGRTLTVYHLDPIPFRKNN
jgi:uncharacterized membrane protein YphA (DoxX/SURF4 family)